MDNSWYSYIFTVYNKVKSIKSFVYTVVAHYAQRRRQEDNSGYHHTDNSLKDKQTELLHVDFKVLVKASQEEVDNNEYDLAGKEEIAYGRTYSYRYCKRTLLVLLNQQFKSQKHEREERSCVVEVVEENVVGLEA